MAQTPTKQHIGSTFKHALIYSGAGIIGKAVGFIMLPVYAHYLRGEGYGIIGMIDVVLGVVTLLIGYGIQGAMSRFYFEKKGEEERKQLISTAIILMFILVVCVSTPLLIFNKQVARLAFGDREMGFYIFLAVLTFIFSMSSRSAETYILIQQRSFFYGVLSLCKLILALSLNIYFIVYLQLGVLGYLYSGLVVAVLFSTFLHGYAFSNNGVHFVPKEAKAILHFSLPLLPGYVAMFIRNNTDRVLLRTFLGLAQLGAFEMLFKFATLIGLFVVEPFSKIMGVKSFEIADQENGPETLARIYTLVLFVMLFVGLILALEIPLILKILTPEEFWLGGTVAALAVLSRIIVASYYYLYFGLFYAKKTSKISLIQISSTAVSFIMCLLLIKPFGIFGAVVASCLTGIFQCTLSYFLAKPYYFIPFEWNKISTIFLCTALIFCFANFFNIDNHPYLSQWLNEHVQQPLVKGMLYLHMDDIKNGKLVTYISSNIANLFEGAIKLICATGMFPVLVFIGVVPKKILKDVLTQRSLKPVVAAMR